MILPFQGGEPGSTPGPRILKAFLKPYKLGKEMEQENKEEKHKAGNWYDRNYKLILLPPILLLAVCLIYIGFFYSQHGDFIYKDASLSGGTTITINQHLEAEVIER